MEDGAGVAVSALRACAADDRAGFGGSYTGIVPPVPLPVRLCCFRRYYPPTQEPDAAAAALALAVLDIAAALRGLLPLTPAANTLMALSLAAALPAFLRRSEVMAELKNAHR
ncbi:MAG: hypothetical protein ACLUEK_09670 [Oscillospiraceae bacterium]